MLITAPNAIRPDHLADVIATMRLMGAPTIHALDTVNGCVAIEGSHRLAAAEFLDLTPVIVVLDPDGMVDSVHFSDIAGDVWASLSHECDGEGINNFSIPAAILAEFAAEFDGVQHRFDV